MSPQTRLERYEHHTEWPLVAVALTFLALYSVRVLAKPHGSAETALEAALIAIFVVFIADYIVRLSLAQPRAKWFSLMSRATILRSTRRSIRLATHCGGR